MPWLNEPAGTVTQWAVENLYDDGETRYFTDFYDEAEAKAAAEVASLELLRDEQPPTGASTPKAYRAVSRQVTYGEWS